MIISLSSEYSYVSSNVPPKQGGQNLKPKKQGIIISNVPKMSKYSFILTGSRFVCHVYSCTYDKGYVIRIYRTAHVIRTFSAVRGSRLLPHQRLNKPPLRAS